MKDNSELLNTKAQRFIQDQETSTLNAEERLRGCLAFMKDCLSQDNDPDFKGFWQVRQFCFNFFKEPLNKHVRSDLWNQYTELTREGRRLKNIFDDESTFAAEQIGLAIQDLDDQVKAVIDHGPAGMPNDFELPQLPQALKFSRDIYYEKQGLLHLLNLFVTRIQSLRKELINTQMRIKQKNALFEQLSNLGDQVFPLRKELMKEVNQDFTNDVTSFAQAHFSEKNFSADKVRRQVFFFRNEIKLFQNLAKILTLDTHAFSDTRTQLSQCWDCLKGMEKELKKEFTEQKQQSSDNSQQFKTAIAEIAQSFAEGQLAVEAGLAKLDAVLADMRKAVLLKNDVLALKTLVSEAMQPMQAKKDQARQEKLEQEAQIENLRKEQVRAFENRIVDFLGQFESGVLAELTEALSRFKQELKALSCSFAERQKMEVLLKQARDKLLEKQESAILELPQESRQLLDELSSLLDQRKTRRAEIKAQLDEYRKVLAGSSLDIEKAMAVQELVKQEKEALEKCDVSIQDIEKKIRDLKEKK